MTDLNTILNKLNEEERNIVLDHLTDDSKNNISIVPDGFSKGFNATLDERILKLQTEIKILSLGSETTVNITKPFIYLLEWSEGIECSESSMCINNNEKGLIEEQTEHLRASFQKRIDLVLEEITYLSKHLNMSERNFWDKYLP
jgi:hypothetical protein